VNKQYYISTVMLALALLFGSGTFTPVLAQAPIDSGNDKMISQKGKIAGKVVDARTGETIIGANVVITGTSIGAATDIDGKYTIEKLDPGIYSVTFSYISYIKKTVTGVEVNEGQVTRLNVSLEPETVGLEEITVTAEASSNSEAGLLAIQRKSTSVKDGLSSEFISKTGDGNVATAIKRVTGVTLLNGQDVYVRGLGNRYSNIQLNGAQVPSTSPTKKEAPVDLVGSGLVDNIVVQKTFTPDQSGEFSGGSVQITTREFPDSRNFSVSYSTSYNTVSTFENTLSYDGSSTDFLGFDDGKRNLPGILQSQRLTLDNEVQVANALHNDWAIQNADKAIPSQKISVNYANQFNQSKLPIGVVSSFSYKYDRNLEPDKTIRKIQSYNDNVGQNILNSDFVQDGGAENVKLSGMLNLFMKPNARTKIGLKSIYSNSLKNSASIISGDFINDPFETRQTVLEFDRRSIFSSTLEFDRYMNDFFDSRLSAKASFSQAVRKRPDRRTTKYNLSTQDEFLIFFDDGGNTHYFENQDDNNYSGQVDYELNPSNFIKIKAGGSALLKKRDFDARRFEYQDFDNSFPDNLKTEDPDAALNPQLVEQDLLDLAEITQNRDSYEGTHNLYAAYLSTVLNPISELTVEIGARVESSDQEVDVNENSQTVTIANVDNTDLLPAANITYSMNEKTNLRGAFSITLARPEFREISDFRFQDFIGSQILFGNPELNRTKIYNYDLRFEVYPNPGELFAISAFYKKFDDPIEKFYRFTERTEVLYKNANEANLYGVEVEGRKNITQRLQMVANASYIFSETRVSELDKNRVANPERPMFGQSPYTANFSAFYTLPAINLDLSVNYSTFGERLVTVGMVRHPDDEYEQPFHSVGLGATYRLGMVTLDFSVDNLLNDDIVYKQGDLTTFRFNPGMNFELGAKLTF